MTSATAAGPNNYGEVDVFEVNSESGHMRQIPTSPFPSGGRNPVAEAVSSDDANLYVVNQDDNTIVQFIIGNDGKLYPHNTVNTPGIFPLAVSVTGSNLLRSRHLSAAANLLPGSAVLRFRRRPSPSAATAILGSPAVNSALSTTYWPLTVPGSPNNVVAPTAVNAVPGGANVFVAAYDATARHRIRLWLCLFRRRAHSPQWRRSLSRRNSSLPRLPAIQAGTYLYVTDLRPAETSSDSPSIRES